MSIIRWIVGRILLTLNFIFSPRSPRLDANAQSQLNQKTKGISLYELSACPFCIKVRREIKRQGMQIELRNLGANEAYREELVREGGKHKVPCLKITKSGEKDQWMYESSEIIQYLQQL
jgi:glutaredoxin